MAGICSTDLEIVKGYMDFTGIPGHEFAGVVETADDPSWVGRRVVGEINCACRSCATCKAGRPNHCPNRTVLGILGRDGAFAEFLTLPLENLHALPDTISDIQGVFVEPVAAAYEILEQTSVSAEDRVVVVGDGRLGLVAAQVLKTTVADVTVIGHHGEKLALVRDRGIHTLLEEDAGGIEPADVVVDCSGSAAGFARSRTAVRPGGRLVLKSTFAASAQVDLSSLVVDEITLIGSRCGPFAPALEALQNGDVQVDSMASVVYTLDQGIEAFSKASATEAIKVFFKMH
jgi:threonine dehydrogenase-like Zn-dependent dehydrogenase